MKASARSVVGGLGRASGGPVARWVPCHPLVMLLSYRILPATVAREPPPVPNSFGQHKEVNQVFASRCEPGATVGLEKSSHDFCCGRLHIWQENNNGCSDLKNTSPALVLVKVNITKTKNKSIDYDYHHFQFPNGDVSNPKPVGFRAIYWQHLFALNLGKQKKSLPFAWICASSMRDEKVTQKYSDPNGRFQK